MDSARLPTDTRNIPHMQLFHHLKQKFPDLKDNDVNESIQKYGLDRERCEEELSQKTQIHHGGYYGPWGRSGSGLSSPSMSRVTSPIRTGIPSTPTTPVLTTTTPTTQMLHHPTPTHHVFGPLQSSGHLVCSYGPGMVAGPGPVYTSPTTTAVVTAPVCYQPPVSSPVGYGWHTSLSNGFLTSGVQLPSRHMQGGCSKQDSPCCSHEASKSRSSTPNSAPVVPNSYDPFSGYENRDPPERRKSAENRYEGGRGYFYNVSEMEQQFDRLSASPYHSPTPPANNIMDSPSSPTAATTTTISTTSSSCLNPSNISGSSSSRPPPALMQEQIARKQKLEVELAKQEEEKGRLQTEVEMMMRELSAREQQRKLNADTNTMRIEEVQRENQRLQSECYELENKILRLAPDIEPEGYPNLPRIQHFNEIPQAHQLTRGSSGSSLGSGTGTPQTPHTPHTPHTPQLPATYIPPRPSVPPPPIPAATVPSLSYREFQGVPGEAVDEIGHKWGCTKCTFINHPDMNKCEMCDYPRFTIVRDLP